MTPTAMERLQELRDFGGNRQTIGLSDETLSQFLDLDPNLDAAIEEAVTTHRGLRSEWDEHLRMDEEQLTNNLRRDFVNFYPEDCLNRYVPVAARGPWIVTSHGAVLHDSGGYGMLGQGHGPRTVIQTMSQNWVMANVMTPSFSQARLSKRLRTEVGHSRDRCPFAAFLCLNSGSEAVSLASRISDINANQMTQDGGRHAGKRLAFLALKGGFHGRTSRPGQVSDSCLPNYKKNLASFRDTNNLVTVEPNNLDALREAFVQADADGVFLEAMFMEPVMGEGNPGQSVTREFYDLARALTKEHGSVLLMDSIQAGIRAHGCLSIVDYPGFQDAEAPDLETYSKALNAGQYPLSVLAVNQRCRDMYVSGVYGNTMTTNPRALEVACCVLDAMTPEMRENIRNRGQEMLDKFNVVADEFPGCITKVQGTGLLVSAELDPERFKVVGFGQVEEFCRTHGVGVIHGGKNALRYTPHFGLTSTEIDLICDNLRLALSHFSGEA